MKPLIAIALIVAGVAACAGRSPTPVPSTTPPNCNATLLKRTPRIRKAQTLELAGHYRWIRVDTVPTRDSVQWAQFGFSQPVLFRLWPSDSVAVVRRGKDAFGDPILGPLSGAIDDFEQKGFTRTDPQIQVNDGNVEIRYDTITNMLDGGYRSDFVPIEVVGTWGFGGYFDSGGAGIQIGDRNGNPVPFFAGYYCAFRIP